MLLLFVVGLGFAPAHTSSSSSPTGSATATPKPTVSVTPSERVLQRKYYKIVVNFPITALQPSAGKAVAKNLVAATDRALGRLVRRHPSLTGKMIGVGVIYGGGPQSDIGAAIKEATEAGNLLSANDPHFRQASFLPGWSGNPPTSDYFDLTMFFYVSQLPLGSGHW
jgi:hypothetical protein